MEAARLLAGVENGICRFFGLVEFLEKVEMELNCGVAVLIAVGLAACWRNWT